MILYYLLFLLFLTFALNEVRLTEASKRSVFILSGFVLVIFAGLRGDIDNDYQTYFLYYEKIPKLKYLFSSDYLANTKLEPSLILLSATLKQYFSNGFPLLIFIYALLGISLKLRAILKIAEFPILSLLFYFASLYLLHDMTQIRTAVALGFVFLGFYALYEKRNVHFFLYILAATLFHYSSIIFAIAFVLNKKRINKLIYLAIILVPLVLNISGYDFLELLLLFDFGIYTDKLNDYIIMQDWLKESINLFNFSILFQMAMAIFFIFAADKIDNYYVILFTKLFSIGIALFYIFSFSPVFAFRLSEFVTSIQIFLIPLMLKLIRPRYVSEIIIVFISILYFLNLIVINNIFLPYKWVFS